MINKNSLVSVVGGSGFLGSYVVKEIAKTGARIRVLSRFAEDAKNLKVNGYVGQIGLLNVDVTNKKALNDSLEGSTHVVNLIGILFEKGKRTFETMHYEVAKNIAEFCAQHKVQRLVHISALGVDRAITSKYAQTKLKAEQEILSIFPAATILRPSVIFGAEDNFLNMFNKLSKLLPALPLIGGGNTKFQPVYVADVAEVVAKTLTEKTSKYSGHIYDLGGPEVLTLKQIYELVLSIGKRKRLLLPLPISCAKIKGFFFEFLPKPLFTRDQVELLKYDNVVSGPSGFSEFGIEPNSINAIAPKYLI